MTYSYGISERMQTVRDCVEGQDKVKRETYKYLPHPSTLVNPSSTLTADQIERYNQFIRYAEFDDAPNQTLKRTLGKMKIDQASIDLPDAISYLLDDVDGDGTTMQDQLSYIAGEVMQLKYCVAVVDYIGADDANLDVSITDMESANIRSVIKTYNRDSISRVKFKRINGIKQMQFIEFIEFDEHESEYGGANIATSRVILALDDNGNYYQEKRYEDSEYSYRNYITINGQPLKYIPAQFISDEPFYNKLNNQLGFIYPICLKCIAKYQVDAIYKECMRSLVPTIYSTGWKHGDADLFAELNNGRSYLASSPTSVNNLPDGVSVDVKSVGAELNYFENYFQKVEQEIAHLGGSTKTGETAKTATEADIDAVERNAILNGIVKSIESGYKRLLHIAAEMEGAENAEITLDMFNDFETPRLNNDEIQRLVELRNNSLISSDEVLRKLEQGGFLVSSLDQVIAELDAVIPQGVGGAQI